MCCRFAFIQFSDTDSATGQMSEKQGAELEGQSLYIDYTGAKSSFKPKDRSFGSDRSFGNSSFGSSGGGRGGSKATGMFFLSFPGSSFTMATSDLLINGYCCHGFLGICFALRHEI